MRQQTDVKIDMDRIRLIFICISVGFSFTFVRGQQVGNYVSNGSFEDTDTCAMFLPKFWNGVDSIASCACGYVSPCNNQMPLNPFGYQWPKHGSTFILSTLFCPPPWCANNFNRGYLRNRLKQPLVVGKTYCITFFVNISNNSSYGIDGFAAYFGANELDTISQSFIPLTFLLPQIQNPNNNIITDTLNWTPVTGTFVATGNEKHLVIGNFKSDLATNNTLINPTILPLIGTDVCIDAVSCIELNLSAYAGPDKSFIFGDSIFIGRQPDFAIDTGCVWYKLPNLNTAIDTISGLWVKPTSTSTYVVRQELDCSPLKWDTVVVFLDAVGLNDLKWYSDNIWLFPNPTETELTVTFGNQADIYKISIINSIGQTVRKVDLPIQKSELTIPTSDLDKGIYLIQLKTTAGIVTKQFVKN
jgi:hypothetical protein